MKSETARKWLRLILFLIGGMLLLAFIPVFFPVSLMDLIHQWLGLDEFPDRPIAVYLAKSTSLLYGVHGVVIVWVAKHQERWFELIPILAVLHVVIGLSMLYIDLSAGMPWWWTAGEGMPIAFGGLVVFWFWKKAAYQSQS